MVNRLKTWWNNLFRLTADEMTELEEIDSIAVEVLDEFHHQYHPNQQQMA